MADGDENLNIIMKQLDIFDKRNLCCSELSGGEKRKLSIAISFLGDAKLILLDEPTSGMDPSSRRRLWEFLKLQKDKIIIISTHFMNEAETIGDRIGILRQGVLEISGSPNFV